MPANPFGTNSETKASIPSNNTLSAKINPCGAYNETKASNPSLFEFSPNKINPFGSNNDTKPLTPNLFGSNNISNTTSTEIRSVPNLFGNKTTAPILESSNATNFKNTPKSVFNSCNNIPEVSTSATNSFVLNNFNNNNSASTNSNNSLFSNNSTFSLGLSNLFGKNNNQIIQNSSQPSLFNSSNNNNNASTTSFFGTSNGCLAPEKTQSTTGTFGSSSSSFFGSSNANGASNGLGQSTSSFNFGQQAPESASFVLNASTDQKQQELNKNTGFNFGTHTVASNFNFTTPLKTAALSSGFPTPSSSPTPFVFSGLSTTNVDGAPNLQQILTPNTPSSRLIKKPNRRANKR